MSRKRKFSEGLLDDELILDVLKISKGQTILDAGCGNGYMAIKFSKRIGKKGKVYAIDINEIFISELKKEILEENIILQTEDITQKISLPSNSIDLVYLSTVFHIFSNIQVENFINEVNRILKPNGILAIINIVKKETSFGPPVEMRCSPKELKKKIRLNPLALTNIGDYFYLQTFINKRI